MPFFEGAPGTHVACSDPRFSKAFLLAAETERCAAVLKFIYGPASSPQASSRAVFPPACTPNTSSVPKPDLTMAGVNTFP